ncbi:MAG: tryptophan--tRNA ligase [Chloroflexi bacterium 44-23]|nr:MAG: tryptophan--tRNA ligase [Chloroflexi bacterium 44-23]
MNHNPLNKQGKSVKQRVFSGIQPTGNIHIGNYLAAIRRWADLQSDYENIFCVVDLHAITIPQDPQTLKVKNREVAALLFAAGIDPKLSSVFIQSHISAHSELAWILNCFIPIGWLRRMTQFKEKSKKQDEVITMGLFDYPALMAADILLYATDLVPVGDDQKQHVELTRDVAQRFNSMYGETFKLPESITPDIGGRIMGLSDPSKKMSKSDTKSENSIFLLDSPDVIRSKVMRATTDSMREIRFDKNRPSINNLLTIYELFSRKGRVEIEAQFEGKGYAYFKNALADEIVENLRPLQVRYYQLMDDFSYIDGLLKDGSLKVEPIAVKTLDEVKEKIGLG